MFASSSALVSTIKHVEIGSKKSKSKKETKRVIACGHILQQPVNCCGMTVRVQYARAAAYGQKGASKQVKIAGQVVGGGYD